MGRKFYINRETPEGGIMSQANRILLIVIILTVDMLVFMLPVTAFFAAYIIWWRPDWFRDWVNELYGTP